MGIRHNSTIKLVRSSAREAASLEPDVSATPSTPRKKKITRTEWDNFLDSPADYSLGQYIEGKMTSSSEVSVRIKGKDDHGKTDNLPQSIGEELHEAVVKLKHFPGVEQEHRKIKDGDVYTDSFTLNGGYHIQISSWGYGDLSLGYDSYDSGTIDVHVWNEDDPTNSVYNIELTTDRLTKSNRREKNDPIKKDLFGKEKFTYATDLAPGHMVISAASIFAPADDSPINHQIRRLLIKTTDLMNESIMTMGVENIIENFNSQIIK